MTTKQPRGRKNKKATLTESVEDEKDDLTPIQKFRF